MRVRIFARALPVVLLSMMPCATEGTAKAPATQTPLGTAPVQRKSAPSSRSENPSVSMGRGKQFLAKKQYMQAITEFTAALNKNDSLKQAYLLRGDCEQQLKKYADAASDYGQYSLLSPNDIGGYLRLSKTYGCLGKNNLALSYLSKAVVLDPRDASIYTARAALYDKLGQHAMAADDRTVAAALAKARTHPNSGVVMTVGPASGKGKDLATNQPQAGAIPQLHPATGLAGQSNAEHLNQTSTPHRAR